VVLLIDEAQDLSPEVLEQIRLISNLETDTEKLLTIVLMGQSELHEMLSRRELRQLAQRVTARYHMSPLDRRETEEYIRHRIEVAGGGGKVTFTAAALSAVHRLAGGIPRLINLICDRALLGGYVQGVRSVEAGMVRRAAREVRGGGLPRRPARATAALATVLVIATASVGALLLRGAPAAPPTPRLEPPRPSPGAVLEPYLLSLSRETSLAGSLEQVESLWGETKLETTSFRTHMGHLKRLDLPVVLEMFHPSRRDTCFLALLEIRSDRALVSSGGDPLRLPLTEIDRLWTRQALFLWRDAEALADGADDARLEAWARRTLAQLGYLGDGVTLTDAVRAFQRATDLTVDGIIGSQTLMALYSLTDRRRPRLQPSLRSADASQAEPPGGPS
jgi:general secretion pathway protein A